MAPAADEHDTRLRIAYLIDVFPRPSNTFIVEQIAGVIACGHDVDIFARALVRDGLRHPAIAGLVAPERLRHIPIPSGRIARVATLLRLLLEPSMWVPAVAREFRRAPFAPGSLSRLYTALSFQRAGPYDVVHCQFGTLGPMAVAMRRSGVLRGALAVSFRGADATRALRESPHLYDALFRQGELFLPVSESLRSLLVAAGCPPERTVVHHSGIDVDRFPFSPRRRVEGEPMHCLFVGRLTEKKGVRYALEALAQLRRAGRSVRLHIVGDGEDRADLERLCVELGLAGAVRFLGRLTPVEVRAEMARAHVLIAPSVTAADGDQEGIPNVLKEAMATGMPVLATVHSGIPELVEHGVSGLLVPERDAAALAKAWSLLDDQPERWPEMGRAGRAAVEAGFEARRLTAELLALYRGLRASPGDRTGPSINRR